MEFQSKVRVRKARSLKEAATNCSTGRLSHLKQKWLQDNLSMIREYFVNRPYRELYKNEHSPNKKLLRSRPYKASRQLHAQKSNKLSQSCRTNHLQVSLSSNSPSNHRYRRTSSPRNSLAIELPQMPKIPSYSTTRSFSLIHQLKKLHWGLAAIK